MQPGVAITYPADGALVPPELTITVDATDDGAIADVELWIDGVRVGVDATAPYVFTTRAALEDGDHVIEARAVDDAGVGSVAAAIVTVSGVEADDGDGGCSAGVGGAGWIVVFAVACAMARPRTGARRGSRGDTGR